MNPIRLIFGLMLVSLCVFGLPEGCLVLASNAAAPDLPLHDSQSGTRPPTEWVGERLQ